MRIARFIDQFIMKWYPDANALTSIGAFEIEENEDQKKKITKFNGQIAIFIYTLMNY